jgi:hypothetical protein
MRRQAAIFVVLMLAVASAGSSALATRSSTRASQSAAIRAEKRLGPKPLPRWYWRWVEWRLDEGYAKQHPLEPRLRPKGTPAHIRRWAWRRLHYFLLARTEIGPGSGPSKGGYKQAISYSRSRPAFVAKRVVAVGNASELLAAIRDLRAGDLVKASGQFTVDGTTVIRNRLSSPAVLDLSGVSFVYSGGHQAPAVWLDNPSYLRIYGGTATTDGTGGGGILVYGSQHVLWWGFTSHNNGGDGLRITPNIAPTQYDDFQGETSHNGLNLAWDPHTEKGSGLHGANLDDSGKYAFSNNRFALYIHDQPTGAAIQYGSSGIAPVNNTIYEKAANLTFVSTSQTGGNAIQFWGVNGQSANINYLEVDNAQGYALFDGGMYSGTTLSGVTVKNGDASNTNQNSRYAGQNPWQTNKNVAYQAVSPTP